MLTCQRAREKRFCHSRMYQSRACGSAYPPDTNTPLTRTPLGTHSFFYVLAELIPPLSQDGRRVSLRGRIPSLFFCAIGRLNSPESAPVSESATLTTCLQRSPARLDIGRWERLAAVAYRLRSVNLAGKLTFERLRVRCA